MSTQNMRKRSVVDQFLDFLSANNQTIMTLLLVFVALVGIWFGRLWWIDRQDKSAQHYFGALVIEYNRALQDKTFSDWDALRTRFEKGFEQHARSTIMPYYKNYVVHILLQQGKHDEAQALLTSLVADTKGSAAHDLYVIEHALMDLDSADTERQKAGEHTLRELSQRATNQYKDTAQFYLGRYYWSTDRIDDARVVWQQLVNEQEHEKVAPSAWVPLVTEYLKATIA